LPIGESDVDALAEFTADELLYRRVAEAELTGGEVDPSRLNSITFDKDVKGAPSVLRGLFAVPADVLHSDCAGGKDVSHYLVYSLRVDDLPAALKSDDGKCFSTYPLHQPERACGAHSVIASCLAEDQSRAYVKLPRSARNDLRTKLAVRMKRVLLPS
jgi:hypothetical protein